MRQLHPPKVPMLNVGSEDLFRGEHTVSTHSNSKPNLRQKGLCAFAMEVASALRLSTTKQKVRVAK
eukprot:5910584-Amphidinium_carterae.2